MKVRINYFLIIAVSIFFVAGCAAFSSQKIQNTKNYSLNSEKQTIIHNPMIRSENIKYTSGKRVEGVSESSEFWKTAEYPSGDSFQEELVYKGLAGDSVFITYRKKDVTWPAYYQELSFDLKDSDIIKFKKYRIKVLEATNNYIRFVVLED
jgi:hypothetical protein